MASAPVRLGLVPGLRGPRCGQVGHRLPGARCQPAGMLRGRLCWGEAGAWTQPHSLTTLRSGRARWCPARWLGEGESPVC